MNSIKENQVKAAEIKEKEKQLTYVEQLTTKQAVSNANCTAMISVCLNNLDKFTNYVDEFSVAVVEPRKQEFKELTSLVVESKLLLGLC